MKKIFLLFLFPIFLLSSDVVTAYTENYPPYNYKKDGKLTGLSVDVLYAIYEKLGLKKEEPTLTNWSRAYNITQKKNNTALFSTTRTEARENLFKWVGPISTTNINLISKKENNIKIDTIEDIKKYKIGTVLYDIGEQVLLEKGISKKNIYSVSGTNAIELSFKKLQKNRIDLFSYEQRVAFYEAKNKGIDIENYESVYTITEAKLYFAFNKNTPQSIIDSWQKALDEIKADGTYQKILSKYEK